MEHINKNIDIDSFGQAFSLSRSQVLDMVKNVGVTENGDPLYHLEPISPEKFVKACGTNKYFKN